MNSTSKKRLRRICACLSVLSSALRSIRAKEELRLSRFPPERRRLERFERLRFSCDVLEEAESNIEEACDNLKCIL